MCAIYVNSWKSIEITIRLQHTSIVNIVLCPTHNPTTKEVFWWIAPDLWVMLTQQLDYSAMNPIGQLNDNLKVPCSHIQFVTSTIQAIAPCRVSLVDYHFCINFSGQYLALLILASSSGPPTDIFCRHVTLRNLALST